MNTKLLLLIGTSLSFLPQLTFAQCVATQDCATLGYTETSCPSGKGIKCPFGNKWACFPSKESVCKEEGFTLACNAAGQIGSGDSCNGLYKKCTCDSTYQYTCTGTGYAGGSGSACGGKYATCKCSSGYEWKNGICKTLRPVCEIGSLYYSDDTCSNNLDYSKSLLGVVIYSNGSAGGGWIMSVNPVATNAAWDAYTPSTTNITDQTVAATCTNTQKLVSLGSRFAAAGRANSYNYGGKKWCLPSYLLLNNINNATNFTKIYGGIIVAGGTKLGHLSNDPVSDTPEYIWSSSEASSTHAWSFVAYPNGSFKMERHLKQDASSNMSIRPVTEF